MPEARSAGFRSILLGLLLGTLAVPAGATNFRLFGPGPRYAAMVGAFTAVADDFTGGYANPAAILQTTSSRIGLGYQWSFEDLEANGELLDRDHRSADAVFLGFAFTVPFKDWLEDRIAFGYNFFQPVDFILSLEVPAASEPQYVLFEQYPRANVMHAALATDPLPWLLVGAGATFSTDLGGSLDLKPGIRSIDGSDSTLTTVDQEAKSLVSPDVGLWIDGEGLSPALEGWAFGATWRARFFVDLEIPITILLSGIPLQLDFISTLIYTPETVTLGAAYRLGDDGVLALDLAWNRWSRYVAPSLVIDTDIEIPILPIELKNGPAIDADFDDTISIRVGADLRAWDGEALDLWVRGGYGFDPSPVPEQTGISNFLDGDKHLLGLGVGLAFEELFGVDLRAATPTLHLTFQGQYFSPIDATKGADVDPSNPGSPTIEGEGFVYYFGTALTVETGG